MKIDLNKSTCTLSTGREFYAYGCILSPDPITGELYGGFDDHCDADFGETPLTREERREIVEHMVELWRQWAER